jgi:threonine/homoserine/homoserine lactone efflux protein
MNDDGALPEPIATILSLLIVGVLFVIGLFIYFLPTIIAFRRRKRDCVAVGALNLLLGWTFVGWAIALIWALKND